MNLSYFWYRTFEYICILLIGSGLFLLTSCQRKTENNSEDSWGKATRIADGLSYTNQDSLFQTVHDSIKDEETRHTLYKILITDEMRFPSTNAYLAFLAKTEKETNDAAVIGIERVYKGRKYYNMAKVDSGFLLMKSGIHLLKQANDSLKLTESYLHLSNFYLLQGHIVLATDAALMGLKYV